MSEDNEPLLGGDDKSSEREESGSTPLLLGGLLAKNDTAELDDELEHRIKHLCPNNPMWVRRFPECDEVPVPIPKNATYVHGLKVAIQSRFPTLQKYELGDLKLSLNDETKEAVLFLNPRIPVKNLTLDETTVLTVHLRQESERYTRALALIPSNEKSSTSVVAMNPRKSFAPNTLLARKRRTPAEWFKKYFMAGQIKEVHLVQKPKPDPAWSWFYTNFIYYRPKWVTIFGPMFLVITTWLIIMSTGDYWYVYAGKDAVEAASATALTPAVEPEAGTVAGWNFAIMMLFGSFIAGATSEGGGSVAFPVMTLGFGIAPSIARDFSLMIQSIGMTAAAFTVVYSEITIEKTACIYGTISGTVGIIISLLWIVPHIPADYTKMIFVAIWLAFAVNLFLMNQRKKRVVFNTLQDVTLQDKIILLAGGLIGGFLSALSGSGLDICMFSILTLYFRLTEKTATPTSVVLMGINTVVGFFTRAVIMQEIEQVTYEYWASAVPVVVVGAPVGAFVSSYLHRQILACFVYFTDSLQFVMALVITKQTVALVITTFVCLHAAFFVFRFMAWKGERLIQNHTRDYPSSREDTELGDLQVKTAPTLTLQSLVVNDDRESKFRRHL